MQELPTDDELDKLLKQWLEGIKYEDERIAKARNKEFWLGQAAAFRAVRKELERICQLNDLKKEECKLTLKVCGSIHSLFVLNFVRMMPVMMSAHRK